MVLNFRGSASPELGTPDVLGENGLCLRGNLRPTLTLGSFSCGAETKS